MTPTYHMQRELEPAPYNRSTVAVKIPFFARVLDSNVVHLWWLGHRLVCRNPLDKRFTHKPL